MGILGDLVSLPRNMVHGLSAGWANYADQMTTGPQMRQMQLDALKQMGLLFTPPQAPQGAPQPSPGILGGTGPSQPSSGILAPPEAPQAGGPAPQAPAGNFPTLPQASPVLAQAILAGLPQAKPLVDLLQANQPQITNINGFAVNSKDSGAVGKYFPSLDKGQEPLYDKQGNIVAVRNLDGSVQAAADMARATEGAKSGAQAAYNIVQVPMPDGSQQSMTQLQAAQLFSGQGAAASGGGSGPAVAAPTMPIGRSQTPADQALTVGNAQTQVARAAAQPQQWSGLTDQARTTDLVLSYIDQALSQIDRTSAGPLALTAALPGTPAYNLRATLDTIKANVGFDKLQQMRNNSPTGGALGQVSEQENRLLQSVLGSVDQGQSAEQLRKNLSAIRDQLRATAAQRQKVYDQMYGGQQDSAQPTAADIEAELRKRKLLK